MPTGYNPERQARALEIVRSIGVDAPANQDECGGCVHCGGAPPNEPYGYAGEDPAHHDSDCPWLLSRQLLTELGEYPSFQPITLDRKDI